MEYKFVEIMPERIEGNILYISLEYNVTKHLCPCGCGDVIVASLSPNRYQLYYDGEIVSLYPSFSNFQKCKSHYFITESSIIWVSR